MRILIGSNGGLTGIYLAKQYRLLDEITVFGADSAEKNIGHLFVEKQFVLPAADQISFTDALVELLNENHIDVYLPTHSREIAKVARDEQFIRQHTSTMFMVSPKETFDALENKKTANGNLKKAGIPVPACYEDFSCPYPIVMKKNIGSGSSGMLLIENEEIHRAYRNTGTDVSFYEKIAGQEYTLDCMYDQEGNLIGHNQRRRVKMIGGAVSITENDDSFDISPWIVKISKQWVFRGCVNFQYIVSDGIPYFIDINLRFPSGGLPLTVASGLDIPRIYLKLLFNQPVEKFTLPEDKKNMTMYRYFEEAFEA